MAYGAAAARGGAWTTAQSLLNKFATIAATWIVARQLSPEQFGAANLALALSVAFVVLAPVSMGDVLVAHQRRFALLAPQARRLMAWIGIGSCALALAAVPAVPVLYRNYPGWALAGLLLLMAFRPLLDALGVVANADLRIRLAYRRIALIDGLTQLGATSLTIALALLGCGAFSLVLPQVLAAGVRTVLYRRSCAPIPPAAASHPVLRPLFRAFATIAFGQYVHNVLVTFELVCLGYFSDELQTGIFGFAFTLAMQANAIIGYQLGGVLQPIFGRLESDPARQRAAFVRVLGMLGFAMVTISTLQIALAPSLFPLAFDARWQASTAVFMVLSLGQAFYFGTAPTMALLKAQRRFGTYLAWQGTQFLASAVAFAAAAKWGGAIAVAWASASMWCVGVLAASILSAGSSEARRGVIRSFLLPWLSAAPVAVATWLGAWWLDRFGTAGRIVAITVLGPSGLALGLLLTRFTAPAVWRELEPHLSGLRSRILRR